VQQELPSNKKSDERGGGRRPPPRNLRSSKLLTKTLGDTRSLKSSTGDVAKQCRGKSPPSPL